MRGLKRVLVERHIGAVLVGFVFAQGVALIGSLIMVPITNAAIRMQPERISGLPPALFPTVELLLGAVRCALTLGLGLLILKWLYLSEPDERIETDSEPDAGQGQGI